MTVLLADRALIGGAFRPAAVTIDGGRITAVEAADSVPADAVRLRSDEVLLPGLVDTHVHVDEPGRTEWEGFATASAAAAAGGVTTIIDMPLNSIPPTIDVPALRVKQRAAAASTRIDVGFWGGAVPDSLGTLGELWEAGVFGFKAFLAPSGVDEFPHLDRHQLLSAQAEIAEFGGLLIVHAEDPDVLVRAANAGGRSYARFVDSRPPEAETVAIRNAIDGARRTGCRTHVLHLSSAAALPLIRDAKADGLPVTVETCPHYLVFDAGHIADGATEFKCCPPIRDEGNREQLWEALADGTIDIVVSDHSPSTAERKFAGDGDFQVAWGGIAGLQSGLTAVWSAARERGIGLEQVIGWMSSSTADFAGLSDRGRIAVGRRADLVVFAPDDEVALEAADLRYRNAVSAYLARSSPNASRTGAVRRTLLAGEDVTDDTRGRLLARA